MELQHRFIRTFENRHNTFQRGLCRNFSVTPVFTVVKTNAVSAQLQNFKYLETIKSMFQWPLYQFLP